MSSTPIQPGADSGDFSLIANRYQIKQKLGRGTYGEVFLAEDLKFNPPRVVAIKILHSKFLNEAEVRADIEREASVLARFNHANILRVIDFDISETQSFIVTELAEGGSLARKIRPDPMRPPVRMPLEEVGWYLEQLTDALDEAHQAGLIHRDLKPLNILLNRRGRPLIADFGLATAVSSSQSSMLVDTQTSGTPPYMAPEQWMGHAGRASDIYALGIITYQLITSELPYQGSQFELFGQHMNAPIPRLNDRAPGLVYPPALDAVMVGVLAKDPKQRTRSALDFYRNYRNALMPFQTPSGSVDSFHFQPGQPPSGSFNFQGQPFPASPGGSNPPGGNINPPQPQINAFQTGPLSGATPPGSNPPTPQNTGGGYSTNYPQSTADANRTPFNTSQGSSTASALPPNNFTPDANRSGSFLPDASRPIQPFQPGSNEANQVSPTQVLNIKPGLARSASKINPGLIIGVGAVVALVLVAAIVAAIVLLSGGSTPTTPTQAAAISPTTVPATTAPAATTATPDATTPAPASGGQAVVARQGSLRKVPISDNFARTAIQGVSSSASSNTTLEVFSSSEAPDKVKTELDNGLVGDGYNYAVPDSHANPPSNFYGGYTKDGSPDLVYVILDTTNLATVLKNNGMDDATVAKIVNDTKGQNSVIFSYEGDGFLALAFPPPTTTPTPAISTTAIAPPTTAAITTAAPQTTTQSASYKTAQELLSNQSFLKKINLPDVFNKSLIEPITTKGSILRLEVFASSEGSNQLRDELNSVFSNNGYTYSVAAGNRDIGTDFYGGYSKAGLPDEVFAIVEVSDLPDILKNNGMDAATTQAVLDATKGQATITFSFEGVGMVNAVFAPDVTTTPDPSATTAAAVTKSAAQTGQNAAPLYNGATL